MLTDAMKAIIETYTVGCLATVRPDGTPSVSPKGTFLIVDDRTVAFAHIRSQGTVDNLRSRADVEVDFIDVFRRKGCRVRGIATYAPRDQAEPLLLARFKDSWPDLYGLLKGVAVIAVTAAEIVTSPAYDVGAVPDALAEHWLRHHATRLGFAVSKRSGAGPRDPGNRR